MIKVLLNDNLSCSLLATSDGEHALAPNYDGPLKIKIRLPLNPVKIIAISEGSNRHHCTVTGNNQREYPASSNCTEVSNGNVRLPTALCRKASSCPTGLV